MIEYDLDTEHSILHVQPKSAIEQDDFVKLATVVDQRIDRPPVGWLVSSSNSCRFPDGEVLGQWSTSSALFEIITSASRKSGS